MPEPDLFVFGLPASFQGYYPGYSKELERHRNTFTWAILKAHTRNRAGTVRLRSADPRDVPEINFRYFDEGNDTEGEDLDAMVSGVRFVRSLLRHVPLHEEELVPGPDIGTDDEVRTFVRDNAWGHHASCTCKLGRPDDPTAVLDSSFRVLGTQSLRVVDASVFPRIPGFFVVTPVYMISEKASDVILADARP
jgi:choline dehydrogenase